MLQDLKAGHILGGTPWKMQIGDIIGVVLAGAVMFIVLDFLNRADIAQGMNENYIGGFGSKNLAAPQAGLMAMLSKGIVGGEMTWPLIAFGMFFGMGLILMQVKSPMLIAVGMYLPLETTFAIFLGGLVKGIVDMMIEKRKLNEAQRARVENIGILLASGLIAGEALCGLLFAPIKIANIDFKQKLYDPHVMIGFAIIILISLVLIYVPVRNAGKPDEPAPPHAIV
jgi:putative OPT family oligopeptide transporter